MRATQQDGTYPRPMMVREAWTSLDGTWGFAHDDADEGIDSRWFSAADTVATTVFSQRIEVPYPPESPASGIGARGFHPVVWYRKTVTAAVLAPTGTAGRRILIHFGAVDFRATVWFDGVRVASHVGGQTPFSIDVTDALSEGATDAAGGAAHPHTIVVRAEDDPANFEQPRGKQDWRETPHGIWYERTTGIWQSVWTESVPEQHISELVWVADAAAGLVRGEITLSAVPRHPTTLDLVFRFQDEVLAEQSIVVTGAVTSVVTTIDALRNGQERARYLWTPEQPALVDVTVTSHDRETGAVIDAVESYLGLRSVSVRGGAFQLNEAPYYVRSVLNQGYRIQTHLAALDTQVLRGEVETIKAMGFNTVRTHQKAEDPRFLFWADTKGLMVWAETAGAYEFSSTAVSLLIAEWSDLVKRDRSHPSIVAWVPVNESWGVQDIATDIAQQQYALALANLTRALDPGRPVMTNEGWEHVDSDILGLHDYTTDADELRRRYATKQDAVDMVLSANGPQGRRPMLTTAQADKFLAGKAPLMITEFGGISLSKLETAWGYGTVNSPEEYGDLLFGLFGALRASTEVTGFCYTQYIDTGQETNGLLFDDGAPKIPMEAIRRIVTGIDDGSSAASGSTFGWTD